MIYSRYFKRAFDLICSCVGLLIFCPVMLIVALAVYVSDGRPVIFTQKRIGLRGSSFYIYKFRTMSVCKLTEQVGFNVGDSSRLICIGKMLRNSKLDELPQLYNVLRGDMSVIGPRPEVEKWTRIYPERWAVVHSVRPGVSDRASIYFRHEEHILSNSGDPEKTYRDEVLPGKLDRYEDYVSNISLTNDLTILITTVCSLFRKKPRV